MSNDDGRKSLVKKQNDARIPRMGSKRMSILAAWREFSKFQIPLPKLAGPIGINQSKSKLRQF